MKCDICGKEKKCQTWDYIIKRKGTGRVRRYTPGTDIVYKVGGKEVGGERNTTYTTSTVSRVADRGTANICMKCRIIWSIILIIAFSIIIALIVFLFLKAIETLSKASPASSIVDVLVKTFEASLIVFTLISLTPLMKHIMLSFKLALKKKVLPWKVMSKFWE